MQNDSEVPRQLAKECNWSKGCAEMSESIPEKGKLKKGTGRDEKRGRTMGEASLVG